MTNNKNKNVRYAEQDDQKCYLELRGSGYGKWEKYAWAGPNNSVAYLPSYKIAKRGFELARKNLMPGYTLSMVHSLETT